jgi:hypothetical protein
VVSLHLDGYTRNQVCEALAYVARVGGERKPISHDMVRVDLAAMGIDSSQKRLNLRSGDEAPPGEYFWRDEDTSEPPPAEAVPSESHPENSGWCALPSAGEVIARIRLDLEGITMTRRYTLGKKDKGNLIKLLRDNLERLESDTATDAA